jgi:DNA-binding NarL/FixJ family response regulator
MTKTIAIIEDNTRFMNYFCDIFQGKKEFSSIHKATDCKEAELLLEARPIDIVFIDLGLPDGNGLAIIDKVSKCWPRCSIIVLSIYADSKTIMQAIKAGAHGYLHKDEPENRFLEYLDDILAGKPNISPMIAKSLLSHFSPQSAVNNAVTITRYNLTEREREILHLSKKGLERKEIAEYLNISLNTVSTHIKRIFTKLNVNKITEAINEIEAQNE